MQYMKSILVSIRNLSPIGTVNIPNLLPVVVSSAAIHICALNSKSKSALKSNIRAMTENCKPPNIFVYTGEETENSDSFQLLKATLQRCLNPDKYIIYHLHPSKLKTIPWQDNTVALVVFCSLVSDSVSHLIHNYVTAGGRLFSLCSNMSCPGISLTDSNVSPPSPVSLSYSSWPVVSTNRGAFKMSVKKEAECEVLARDSNSSQPLILKCLLGKGVIVNSQVHLSFDEVSLKDEPLLCVLRDILSCHLGLDCSDLAPVQHLTPAHLFIKTGAKNLKAALFSHLDKNCLRLRNRTLDLSMRPLANDVTIDLDDPYPVVVSIDDSGVEGFDWPLFQQHLETHHLGSTVFYTDIVTSTMDFIDGLPIDVGAVSVANIQTNGKGRAGNAWLSPRGCAMFSVQLCLGRDSRLGGALPFVQQLTTLAVLQAIKDPSGPYQCLDIGLKWPNDLYYAKKVKFGGILAKSTMIGNTFHCYIGLGVNLNNSLPTVCINDLIRRHNEVHGTQMEPLRLEVLVARTLSHLERLVDVCQQQGTESCLKDLYQHWIHRDQTLMLEAINEEVKVQGVDGCGFLCVQRSQGQVLTLHPDGNSLDQMKNLLIAK